MAPPNTTEVLTVTDPRPQWEYKTISFPLAFKKIGTDKLDEAGRDGWELVSLVALDNAAVAALKRRLLSPV